MLKRQNHQVLSHARPSFAVNASRGGRFVLYGQLCGGLGPDSGIANVAPGGVVGAESFRVIPQRTQGGEHFTGGCYEAILGLPQAKVADPEGCCKGVGPEAYVLPDGSDGVRFWFWFWFCCAGNLVQLQSLKRSGAIIYPNASKAYEVAAKRRKAPSRRQAWFGACALLPLQFGVEPRYAGLLGLAAGASSSTVNISHVPPITRSRCSTKALNCANSC